MNKFLRSAGKALLEAGGGLLGLISIGAMLGVIFASAALTARALMYVVAG